MYPLTLGWMLASEQLLGEVKSTLQAMQARVVLEISGTANRIEGVDRVAQVRPEVLILDFGGQKEAWADLLQRIRSIENPPLIVAVHEAADPDTILWAMRAGAAEYVYPPVGVNLRVALDRLSEELSRGRGISGQQARTLGVFSAKGGCGATTIACQMALLLSELTRRQILLADFDLEVGLVGFLMKAKSRYSLLDALRNTHRLDLSYWKALISNGVPGLEVIPAPPSQEVKDHLPPEQFQHILRFVRLYYDWVLVDLGRSLGPTSLTVLEDLDEALLVATPELPALFQVKRIKETLLQFGFSLDRLHLVLNRVPKNLDVGPEEVKEMLGVPVYATLPEDYQAIYESYGSSQVAVAKGAFGKQMRQMANRLSGQAEKEDKKKFRLFG